MRKLFTLWLAMAIIMISAGNIMAQDIAPKLTQKFFPDGKVEAPTIAYAQYSERQYVYLWFNQPKNILALNQEKAKIDDEGEWENLYGCNVDYVNLQVDVKIDGGNYHHQPSWDENEYQDNLPNYLLCKHEINANSTAASYQEGTAVMDSRYSGEEKGFMKDILKTVTEDDNTFDIIDLESHTATFRTRYIIHYRNDSGEKTIFSDWSNEVSIGKNGTQKNLEAPKKIVAPEISEFKYERGYTNDAGTRTTDWSLYVKYPQSILDAEMYYCVNGAFEPIKAITEYRVNGGEWQETYWGNPEWLSTGYKGFSIEDTQESDKIEFRVHLSNNADENLQGEYSEILVAQNGKIAGYEGNNDKSISDGAQIDTDSSNKCKVCGICPIQPLGICLFIWIAIIIVVIIVIVIIAKKGKKEEK